MDLSTLAGGKVFSKIDLSQAYQQLPLADESKQLTLIKVCFAPFGVSSAPGVFQHVMYYKVSKMLLCT